MALVAVMYSTSDGQHQLLGWARHISTAQQVSEAMQRSGYTSWTWQSTFPEPGRWAPEWTEVLGYYRGQWYYFGKYDWYWLPSLVKALTEYFGDQVYIGIENNPTMQARMGGNMGTFSMLPVVAFWRTA